MTYQIPPLSGDYPTVRRLPHCGGITVVRLCTVISPPLWGDYCVRVTHSNPPPLWGDSSTVGEGFLHCGGITAVRLCTVIPLHCGGISVFRLRTVIPLHCGGIPPLWGAGSSTVGGQVVHSGSGRTGESLVETKFHPMFFYFCD